ncbi:glycosylation-dependent cell adhesion molecule 1-like [Alexandromys fortis]|uniref:glycosylation-dependent cell adhesion molecule 1-like n=1 Tax=Alexandromys fortis TaxID=100897 RepID=UPI00215372A2|nr:glycosylation-dependent cell adhesion molecule 1-like [Microtus fortis]
MNFFTVLLFASLATTSLAVLPVSLVPASQSTPTSHISKESTSSNNSSKEPSIFREESVFRDNVLIECAKSKSQKAQARLRSGASHLEETIGPITSTGVC